MSLSRRAVLVVHQFTLKSATGILWRGSAADARSSCLPMQRPGWRVCRAWAWKVNRRRCGVLGVASNYPDHALPQEDDIAGHRHIVDFGIEKCTVRKVSEGSYCNRLHRRVVVQVCEI